MQNAPSSFSAIPMRGPSALAVGWPRPIVATPRLLRGMRLPSALLLGVVLGGCATLVVPTQVRLPALEPGADQVRLLDVRPQEAREYREQGPDLDFKFLGDDAIVPNPVNLVASWLAEALPESRRGRPIELRRLDIGFRVVPRSLLPPPSGIGVSVQSGTPAAAIAAGILTGYAMIAALSRETADESGVAYIEVWIGGDSLRSAQTVAVSKQVSAGSAVELALANALDELSLQARALSSGERASP